MSKRKQKYHRSRPADFPPVANPVQPVKKKFYEKGAWPAISFFFALIFLSFNLIEKGVAFYQSIRGPQIEFVVMNGDLGYFKSETFDRELRAFMLIRGTLYNTGKKPLRIKEYSIQKKINDKWIPMLNEYPRDTISIGDFTDTRLIRNIIPSELKYLTEETIIQLDDSKTGCFFVTLPLEMISLTHFGDNLYHDMRLVCVTPENDHLKFDFTMQLKNSTEVYRNYGDFYKPN